MLNNVIVFGRYHAKRGQAVHYIFFALVAEVQKATKTKKDAISNLNAKFLYKILIIPIQIMFILFYSVQLNDCIFIPKKYIQ